MTPKIILDLDTGIDDAMALAYALGCPDLELIGVTGTYGNVTVEQGVRNSLALLELLGHPEVPVFAGPTHASDKESFEVLEISAFIHGRNGLGNVGIPDAAGSVDPRGAVEFLIESVRTYGDDLVIVPTGPSTTIAAAMKEDPEFAANAHIVFMGGALVSPGNVNAWAEANVNQDPAATDYLLRNAADVSMVGLDVTTQPVLTRNETQRWGDMGLPAAMAFADIVNHYIDAYDDIAPHLGGCALHDPLAVAVAADPSLVTWLDLSMKVDVEGPTRGRTIGDETKLGPVEEGRTSRVAVAVDVDRFVRQLTDTLWSLFVKAAKRPLQR